MPHVFNVLGCPQAARDAGFPAQVARKTTLLQAAQEPSALFFNTCQIGLHDALLRSAG
jgi:hypothetical protein